MEKLFTPFQTGDTDLVNRVVMAPMTRSRAMTSDTADELTAKYYRLRESVWGKPEVVRDGLRDLVRRTGADEIMVNSWQGTRLCRSSEIMLSILPERQKDHLPKIMTRKSLTKRGRG